MELKDRIAEVSKGLPRGWQKQLATHCGVKPPSVSGWLSGDTKTLEGANLLRAAEFFRVTPGWLATGKLPKFPLEGAAVDDEAFADVKRVDVAVSAGHGAEPVVEETIGSLKFKNSFLRSLGVSATSARIVNVSGDSMDPTIKDGAVILVSTKNRDPINNAIFALARAGPDPLIVKRLLLIDGQWIARSDNRDFADIKIGDGEPVTIIGRAMWMGARL